MNHTGYSTQDGLNNRRDARTDYSRLRQGSLFHGFASDDLIEKTREAEAASLATWECVEIDVTRGERLQHVVIEMEDSRGKIRRMEFTTLSRNITVIYIEAVEFLQRNCPQHNL